MNDEQTEARSLQDLARILQAARKMGIKLLLIGGYAVMAHTRGHRFTKDIDLIADRPAIGQLKGLLTSLGYSLRDTEFGIAGSKRLKDGFIDLHISVGKVHDISTDRDYRITPTLFKDAQRLPFRGFYSTTPSFKAPVIDLETLLILKLMPVGRWKDAVDILSLLTNRRTEVDITLVAKRAQIAGLKEHLVNQVRDYARRLREGELDQLWSRVTASRLPATEKRQIGSFFTKLADALRQP